MVQWRCAVLAVLALAGTLPSGEGHRIMFGENTGSRCGPGRECVLLSECPSHMHMPAANRRRSDICGFLGLMPRVCCDTAPPPLPPPDELPPPSPTPPPLIGTVDLLAGEPVSARHPTLLTNCGKPSFVSLNPPYQRFYFIVGGEDADISRWPWMVLLGRWKDGMLSNWFCGGTLITPQHVLTAAHCLRPEEAGTVGARVGDSKLSTNETYSYRELNVSRIILHPGYTGGRHDIAVVKLDQPLELESSIRPICLPPPGTEFPGQDVAVAGRGLVEFAGQPADRLQEAPLRVADTEACEAAYRRVPQFRHRFPDGFQGSVVCAESRDGEPRDACRGDSGGPLTVELPAEVATTFQLVGVVSAGVGCGNPEFPGVYTKVSAYIDWITEQLT